MLVFLPRNRFTAELPERIADIVAEAYGAEQRTFESLVSASSLARITVSVRRPIADTHADLDALERTIDEQSTSWNDRLRAALVAELGEAARPSRLRARRAVGIGGVPGRCRRRNGPSPTSAASRR